MKNKQKIKIKSSKKVVNDKVQASKFDPFGSYTGVPIDGGKPVQDQDDLWKYHHLGGFLLQ